MKPGRWHWCRDQNNGIAALAAAAHLDQEQGDAVFYRGKIATAFFYADQLLPLAAAHGETVKAGDAALATMPDEAF